jgi:hypothetical protein
LPPIASIEPCAVPDRIANFWLPEVEEEDEFPEDVVLLAFLVESDVPGAPSLFPQEPRKKPNKAATIRNEDIRFIFMP